MKLRPFYRWGIVWYVLVLLCAFGGWSLYHRIQSSRLKVDELPFPEGHPTFYQSISLERTACFGTCPVYTVTLHQDGRAEYQARAHLPELGNFEGKFSSDDFKRLSYFIEKGGFERLSGKYKASHTDDSTCILRATSASGIKVVSNYGDAGPIDLWAVEELIDGIRARIAWSRVSNSSH